MNFSPDGKTLASGSGDSTIKLWNLETFAETKTMSGHGDEVRSVSFRLEGKNLSSISSLEAKTGKKYKIRIEIV